MEKIKINEKEYELRKIDFNAVCELEDLGFSPLKIGDKSFSSIRALVAFIAKCDIFKASKEIENHIAKGGKLDDFYPLITMVTNSDFFRNLSK